MVGYFLSTPLGMLGSINKTKLDKGIMSCRDWNSENAKVKDEQEKEG